MRGKERGAGRKRNRHCVPDSKEENPRPFLIPFINKFCEEVGSQIRNVRKEQRLSQQALAKKMGVSQQLISRIERGQENVSLITLTNVMKALNKQINMTFA